MPKPGPAGPSTVVIGRRSVRARVLEDPARTLRRKYLTPEEEVYYEDPPAALSVVFGIWWLWVVLIMVVLFVATSGTDAVPVAMVALVVTGLLAGYQFLQRYYERFVITSLRVIHLKGVLTREISWMPLGRITDITFKQNVFERVLGFADLEIHSASEATGLRRLNDVADPARFHRIVTALVEKRNNHTYLGGDVLGDLRALNATRPGR